MIDSSFVDSILEHAQPEILQIGEKAFSTAQLHNLPLAIQPDFPGLSLLTLDSLVDYIEANRDAATLAESQIRVTHATANLLSRPIGELRKRDLLAQSSSGVELPQFGGYQPIEEFRIWLLTQFRDTPDRETVLKFIAKVSDEHVATSEDNGVSQYVTIKTGIASHGQGIVPSPIQLAPIRTFIEVEQPIGHFLFRLKQAKDALPTAALFELHTNWKRAASVSVKDYLDDQQERLGDKKVPVFA